MVRKPTWGPQARRLQRTLAWTLITICAATGAQADTLQVPFEYRTIQAAIDAAIDGDTVLVADGTYTGEGNRDMDFGGRAITVRSENGAETCTIDLQANENDQHRAFTFDSGETAASAVKGFTIRRGFMNRGGAVLCEVGSSPLFEACVFKLNSVSQTAEEDGGGAVYTLGSSPAFIDCQFLQNQAEANFIFGGGGAVRSQSGSSPTFTGCTFSENSAFGTDSDGGAVAIWDGGHPEFFSCTFTANQAIWDGAVVNYSGVTMQDCLFQGNVATGSFATGGAFGQWAGDFGEGDSVFVNCSFIGNTALWAGGGAGVHGSGATASFTNCSFIENFAMGGSAGGIFVQKSAVATFTNCLFADNEAVPNGGGLWVGQEAQATVSNCTFVRNDASNLGGGLYLKTNASADLANCVLWNNLPDQIGVVNADPPSVVYSDIEGGWAGDGNIDTDPLFVDSDNGDFHLAGGSPCIDSANNAAVPVDVTTDLDGNPRFVDIASAPNCPQAPFTCGAPPIVDMGPYELQLACAVQPDCDDQDVCTFDACNEGECSHDLTVYGDADNSGVVDLDDILCVIAGFGNFDDCPSADFAPPCTGNGIINLDDILAIIGAFGGTDPCCGQP